MNFQAIAEFFKNLFAHASNNVVNNNSIQPLPFIQYDPIIPENKPMDLYTKYKLTIPSLNTSMSGTDFGNSILNVPPNQYRDDLICAQYQNGNIPDFMRNPIEITTTSGNNTLTYVVLPDVLCVGSNEDYLRTPLLAATGRKVADLFHCVLPTRKMANQIWKSATIKLNPAPNGPPYDQTMENTDKFIHHNERIQTSLVGKNLGELITGHKKDVVFAKHITADPSRIAIYGWFYTTGLPIQNLNATSHDKLWHDYSQCFRMVSRTMFLNGNEMDFYDVLRSGSLSSLISDEGNYDASKMYL